MGALERAGRASTRPVTDGSTPGRALAIVLAACLVACTGAGAPSTGASAPVPTASPTATTVAASPTAAPTPPPTPTVTKNVSFERSDPVMTPGLLDVYQPPSSMGVGPFPVVVMFHGFEGDKGGLRTPAMALANHGYVAFVPEWGWVDSDLNIDLVSPEGIAGSDAQNACALAFVESQAAKYDGDPAQVIVFGHSGGAMASAGLAFNPGKPAEGCLATDVRPADGFVAWEGDWLNEAGFWTDLFKADPALVDQAMIWSALKKRTDLKVGILQGETSDMPDLAAADLAIRDPSGALRKVLEKNGALADGAITIAERQQLLAAVLQAQGNPVTLGVMPGSTHESIGTGGWPVFLAAFDRIAGR